MSLDPLTGGYSEQFVAGITVTAPGLVGSVESLGVDPGLMTPGIRLLHSTLENSGLHAVTHIALTHSSSAAADATFTVPAPTPGFNSVLLIHDSSGALSWHMRDDIPKRSSALVQSPPAPNPRPGSTGLATADSSNIAPQTWTPTVSFTVPARRLGGDLEHVSRWAHIVGLIEHFRFHPHLKGAGKMLSVLEYPVEHLVGSLGADWFAKWETNKHPYVVRWFPPEGDLSVGEPLSATNWHQLAAGPTLLFIHGIFSDCASGFSGIGKDDTTWATLRERYGNRIIAFDHPTASVSPAENAEWLLSQLPNVNLDLDIICHSRGGLVARSLAKQSATWGDRPTQSLRVGRVVFAATPNGGSQITEAGKWEALVNRISSAITLPARLLPAPADMISAILGGLIEVVKIVGVGVALDLPGLEDMSPGSEFLRDLAATDGRDTPEYFAATADFEPGRILATLFNHLDDEGRVVDLEIFGVGVRNDIAVPSDGVWNPAGVPVPPDTAPIGAVAGFPIDDPSHRLDIGPGSTYWHCDYFDNPDMRAALLRWLPRRDMTVSGALAT